MSNKDENIDKVMQLLDEMIAAKTQKSVTRLRTEISEEITKAGEQLKGQKRKNDASADV